MNTTETKVEILPCPFCGQQPRHSQDPDGLFSDGSGTVECRNIECPIGCTADGITATVWNTRSPDQSAIAAARDALKELLDTQSDGDSLRVSWSVGGKMPPGALDRHALRENAAWQKARQALEGLG
jgi:hypothetical protein